eukprot:g62568.t1
MSKVAKLLGYRKHALGTVEVEVDKSDNWLELGAVGKDGKFCFSGKLTEEEEKARQDEQNKIAEQAKQQENKLIETIQEKEKEEKEKQRLETERIERERAEAEQKAQKDKEEREKKEAEARKEALESINFDKPLEPTPVQTSALDSIIFDKLLAPPAGDGNPPVGDGKAEILVADTQKDKKPDPATLCSSVDPTGYKTPLDYRTPGTVKGEQQSRATTAVLESMVSKNMKNLALYPRKIAITREGEDVWVVGVQCKLSKQFLNKGGRDVTDLQKTIWSLGAWWPLMTVIDPIASELVGDVPDDEWNPEVPPLLVLMAPASQTPLENLPVIYDFAWVQEQPGNGGTYVNGRPKRQVKPKPEPEAEPVSSTPVQVTKQAKKTKTKAPKPKADPKPGNPGKPRKQPKVEHVEIIDQKEPAEKEKTLHLSTFSTL